jgi:GABA permease
MSNYKRLLVIANETIAGKNLHQQIREMIDEGGEILVVAPALGSRLEYLFSAVDEPRAHAKERLAASLESMAADGLNADGAVGDANPVQAMKDAIAVFEPDAVVVSTHTPERSNWIENGVVDKIKSNTDLPVTHVVVDLAAQEAGAPAG